MKLRQLGKSNLKISEIGFGCMSLDVQSDESESILLAAFESGINFFDTADLYDQGENEKLVGRALRPVRDQVVIATKVGNEWRKDRSGWDWNPKKEYLLKAVDASLLRLQTDYIDLYQLHGGTIDDPIDEIIEAFELLKEQGKIREYGISSIRPNVIREWIKRSNVVSVMMQYSLLDRRPEEEMLDLIYQNNISVITRGTLAKGLLINKPAKEYLGYSVLEISDLQNELRKTGKPLGASIQFVLDHPAIASAALGIRTPRQLQSIVNNYQSQKKETLIKRIKKELDPTFYQDHR